MWTPFEAFLTGVSPVSLTSHHALLSAKQSSVLKAVSTAYLPSAHLNKKASILTLTEAVFVEIIHYSQSRTEQFT
jgi:hypothetical protein